VGKKNLKALYTANLITIDEGFFFFPLSFKTSIASFLEVTLHKSVLKGQGTNKNKSLRQAKVNINFETMN